METMKEKLFSFCEKYLVGGTGIKINSTEYINFPKTAIYMFGGALIAWLGELNNSLLVKNLGLFLVLTGFFSFFYYNIFPNRQPKK